MVFALPLLLPALTGCDGAPADESVPQPEEVFRSSGGEIGWVRVSPRGDRLVYTLHDRDSGLGGVYVSAIDGGDQRRVSPVDVDGRRHSIAEALFAPDGRSLLAILNPIPEAGEAVEPSGVYLLPLEGGVPVQIVDGGRDWHILMHTTSNERLLVHGSVESGRRIFSVRLDGADLRQHPVPGGPFNATAVGVFPEGGRFLYYADPAVGILSTEGEEHTPLPLSGGQPVALSRNGQRILYRSFAGGVHVTDASGGGRVQLSTHPQEWPSAITGNGRHVLVGRYADPSHHRADLYALDVEQGGRVRLTHGGSFGGGVLASGANTVYFVKHTPPGSALMRVTFP